MKLKRLTLTNFRIFEQATFDFQLGMNLLVGINGAGKSSVLDALRMLLSRALPESIAPKERPRPIQFTVDDFTIGRYYLTGELYFMDGSSYSANVEQDYIDRINLKVDPTTPGTPMITLEGNLRGPMYQETSSTPEQPLAVYFSPRRSLPIYREPSKRASAGGRAAAYADALSHRELRVREFAEWMLVQAKLSREEADPIATRRLDVLHSAFTRFLENYISLAATQETIDLLDKDEKPLHIEQLSDGERGLLALILDLARRLSQANPELDDPLRDGKAVVLIDELDLHLHPSWQRTVIEKLTKTFPNCQFIATTHSPQIIGEVSPDNIILLERGKPPYRPDQSLGMDSNWILRHLMGASERDSETEQELSRIAGSIEDEQYDKATTAIETLRSTLGEFPELVRLQTRIDRIRLLGE